MAEQTPLPTVIDGTSSSFSGMTQQPLFKAILQFLPFGLGSAIDVILTDGARQIQEERFHTFFEELAAGDVELTPALVKDQEFLHRFFSTARAVSRTKRSEKIRLFARLLKNGAREGTPENDDEFEENLSSLEGLSYREWQALCIFETHLSASKSIDFPQGDRRTIWPNVRNEISASLAVPVDEVFDFLSRTTRSGLFRAPGTDMSSTGHGTTTPAFRRLQKLVADDSL